jgi:hypothetical protein
VGVARGEVGGAEELSQNRGIDGIAVSECRENF